MANAGTAKYVIKLEDRTKKAFKSIGRGLNKTRKAVFSLKTGMVSVAGIAGMGYMIKRSMDATDELAKMSRAVGVSVENLSRLRHAANLGGMEAKKLDKAVQKLAVNMGDMSRGIGLAKDVFEKYNITVTNSDGSLRGITDVMGDVADVFQGVTNKTEKADMAYKLFGARGAEMINILEGGKVALNDMLMEADKLGLVMSSETAKGVEDANDAITRLSGFLTSTFHQAVAKLSPAIQLITDNIREWVEMKIEKEGGVGEVAREMANAVILSAINMIEALDKVGNAVIGFVQKVQKSIPAALGGFRDVNKILEDIRDTEIKIGMTKSAIKNGFSIMDIFGEGDEKTLEILSGELSKLNNELDRTQDSLIGYEFNNSAMVDSLKNLIIYKKDLTKATKEDSKLIKDATKSYRDLNTTLSDSATAYGLIGEHINKNIASQTNQLWKGAKAGYKEYEKSVLSGAQVIANITTKLMKGTEDVIHNMVMGIKTDFKALTQAIISDLARMAIRKAIVTPLFGMLGFANGGRPPVGRPSIVGERGAELFVPDTAGTIIPNHQLNTATGEVRQVNAEINFNVQAIDANSFNTYLVHNKDTIEGIINSSLTSNGSVRRTINQVA